MDEQACYEYLLEVLRPGGLQCPQGHSLAAEQADHGRHLERLAQFLVPFS